MMLNVVSLLYFLVPAACVCFRLETAAKSALVPRYVFLSLKFAHHTDKSFQRCTKAESSWNNYLACTPNWVLIISVCPTCTRGIDNQNCWYFYAVFSSSEVLIISDISLTIFGTVVFTKSYTIFCPVFISLHKMLHRNLKSPRCLLQ